MKLSLAVLALTLSSSIFAQTFDDNTARDNRIKELINSNAASKCADGSAKVYQDMGYLKVNIDRPYIAKSEQQVFVTITPKPQGNHVELYYCPIRNISMQGGQQKSVNIPLAQYSYNLGELRKIDNCEYSDILSGRVGLVFQGMSPIYVDLRPIRGTQDEQKEYGKLCGDKVKPKSKVGDEACVEAKPTVTSELTEQVSETLKKKFNCDMRDLVTGQMLLGGGLSVSVDEVNKKAEVISRVIAPGAQDRVEQVLGLQQGTSKYSGVNEGTRSSFELLDQNSGILTQTFGSTTRAYSCRVK